MFFVPESERTEQLTGKEHVKPHVADFLFNLQQAKPATVVLRDQQVLAKRDDSSDEGAFGDATCPKCGHEFSIFDDEEN